MKRLYLKKYENRIVRLTDFLTQSQRHVGNNVGWHQHLNTRKIGIVATSMALLYYKSIGKVCPEQEKCIKFLKDSVNEDGGWSYISNASAYSNVESTCWTITALSKYRDQDTEVLIENGINWILSQHPVSNNDAGFPFASGSVQSVYITALVLKTLNSLDKTDSIEFESAKQWLIYAQNDDGGWGSTPEEGSSLFFTSYCISTLAKFVDCDDLVLRNALKWLNNRLLEIDLNDPSLICYLEFIENKHGNARDRISFFHYVLPHVVTALIDMKCFNNHLFNCVYLLYQRCEDGRIEHPDLENSKIYPIWALYDSGLALTHFRKQFNNSWRYVLTSMFNRIYVFRKWNPLQLLTYFGKWMWGVVLVFLIVYVISFYWDQISSIIPEINPNLLSLIISLCASFIYGSASWIVNIIYKRCRR